jgi:hypothetical protein
MIRRQTDLHLLGHTTVHHMIHPQQVLQIRVAINIKTQTLPLPKNYQRIYIPLQELIIKEILISHMIRSHH